MKISIKNTLLFVLSIIFMNANSQSNKRGYKFLERLDYIKAFETFEEILQEDNSNPAANFGMALLYSNDDFVKTDYLTAWKYVDMADKNFNSLGEDDSEILKEYLWAIETRKTSRPVEKKFQIHKEEIENKLIKYLREENNLEYVNRALDELKGFKHYDNIVHIRNYLEYRKAENTNTLQVFQGFIKKYPDAAQVELATEKIHELAFAEAKLANTYASLQGYIDRYPLSSFIPEAVMLRNKLEFEKARKQNTFDAYNQFLSNYPNSIHVPRAKELQKKLVYEQAKQINTIEAYNRFISMYPEGAQYVDIFNLKARELGKKYGELNHDIKLQIDWSEGFDLKELDDIPTGIELLPDGRMVLAGATQQEADTSFHDAWVVFLDNQGKMKWNKTVGEYLEDWPSRIIMNSENEIIIGGYSNTSFDSIDSKAWLFKLAENGDKIWNRSLEIPEILALDVNSKGEILVGGYLPGDSAQVNYILYKLTKDGRKFWERKYSNPGVINDVEVINGDKIVIAGSNWIWQLDDNGYIEWEKDLEPGDSIVSLSVTGYGEILLSGARRKNECLLMKLDNNGNSLWEKSYASEVSGCVARNIISDNAGNIYFTLKLNGISKIIKTGSQGEIIAEKDFNRVYTKDIPAIKLTTEGKIQVLVSANHLGQKNDFIILTLSL